jgi:hypothetical protein
MKTLSIRPTRVAGAVARVVMLSSGLALAGLSSVAGAATVESRGAAKTSAPTQASASFWQEIGDRAALTASRGGVAKQLSVQPTQFRAATLDKAGISAFARSAPMERTTAAALSPLVLSLPHPDGGFQRFALVESPIMEEGLAAKHPNIKTYAGKGIDDPRATLRMDITPLGLHASVRSPAGSWYVDPYYHLDDSVYASYHARNLPNTRGALIEPAAIEPQLSLTQTAYRAGDSVEVRGAGFTPGATVTLTVQGADASQTLQAVADAEGVVKTSFVAASHAEGAVSITADDARGSTTTGYRLVTDAVATTNASVASEQRVYRLALVTDPSYATYFGGSANVTPAKVTLINRVTQIYEDETSIRLVLINDTDKLNLDTAAMATGANGPCGATACYTTATLASCGSGQGLARNRIVIGLLVGASNYDVGHLALGVNGGGVAGLGVVGGANKGSGCTGIPTPVGDYFAVDYVAHELGHQFAGNHTFNGTVGNCSTGNRNANTSVEPGSGSSIMAYAGICSTDNLQTHSDPYWSQRSFDEITTLTSSTETNLAEVQMGVLGGYTVAGAQFQFSHNGNLSAPIVRGTNNTAAGIKAAIEGIAGWPANATVTASGVSDTAFTLTFPAAAGNVPNLAVVPGAGVSVVIGELTAGGQTTKRGITQVATGNSAPVVSVPGTYNIPVRTPFALTGSATDVDGDTLTYLWEQNDRGASGTGGGTGLVTQPKLNGPLFRQFGTRAVVSNTDTLLYGSPGQNHVTTNPTRVFPDMAQILANNTNAETGSCALVNASALTPAEIECLAESLPTASYVGTANVNASPASLNFRMTVRDGRGGVNSGNTQLILAPGAGPFLVTSPNTAVTLASGNQTVTWSVANTNAAPVSTANVKISLSTDSGETFPTVLAASVPNSGSAVVTLPAVSTTKARIKVEAIGNVFFDVSNADFSIKLAGDVNGDGAVNCADVAVVKASMGKRTGQAGFDARADVDGNGAVDIRDLAFVTQRLPAGTSCN